jgi:hypothetical protein
MLGILGRDTRHISSFPGSFEPEKGIRWMVPREINFPLRRENAIAASYYNFRRGIEVDATKRFR